MEERKIIDLTGNMEEKIAPKHPGSETPPPSAGAGKNRKNDRRRKKNRGGGRRFDEDFRKTEKPAGPEEGSPEQEEPAAGTGETVPLTENAPAGSDETPASVSADGEPVPQEEAKPEETAEVVGVRFRGTGKVYFFAPGGISFLEGEHVIVETVRGVEYGDVALGNHMVPASKIVQPLKPVTRKGTDQDAAHFEKNCRLEEGARPVFVEKCKKNKLEMQLVDVEYTFDNTKLTFYFTADGRVDFRELVKDLAAVFHTRIDLRQIGPRDEARLFGGLGVCGLPVCCKQFLKDFEQATIKMAKDQNISLASGKINGLCGKRMCCLKFEQEMYEQESKRMPQPQTEIDTPKGKAVVLESSFLSEKVKVKMNGDGTIRTYTLAELNGEEKPEKTPRRTRTGSEGFALRDSYEDGAPELPADEGETGPNPKTGSFGPQNKGRGNAGKKNPHNKPHRDNPVKADGLPEKKAGPGGEKRKQKQKNRFNRPNNLRKKDASGGKNTDGNGP